MYKVKGSSEKKRELDSWFVKTKVEKKKILANFSPLKAFYLLYFICKEIKFPSGLIPSFNRDDNKSFLHVIAIHKTFNSLNGKHCKEKENSWAKHTIFTRFDAGTRINAGLV